MLNTLLFDGWESVIRAFLMTLLAYPFLILLLRTFGKRTLTQVNIFDFVITITYGATLSTILLNRNVSLADGAVVLFMLTALQFIVSKISVNSDRFSSVIKAKPVFIYHNGRFNEKAMQQQRIRMNDIRAKVRQNRMSSFEQVEAVVLEGDGSLSVVRKEKGSANEALEGVQKIEE